MNGTFTDLIGKTFGIQPTVPEVQPAPAVEEPKTYKTRNSVVRDVNPDTMAAVQSMVWKDGPMPPPAQPQIKAPTNKMMDVGVAPTMNGQPTGWGKLNG